MSFNSAEIIQYHSGKIYKFKPAFDLAYDERFLNQIVAICNEKLIYNSLFKEACQGAEYSIEKAQNFLEWATEGFQKSSHFVFLITSDNNVPVGAIDIKQNTPKASEIGYWLSEHHRGLMVNTVCELAKQAKINGFKSLYGMCKIDNLKSQRVLERANFTNQGQQIRNSKKYFKYSKSL